jgi:hypothetical protein
MAENNPRSRQTGLTLLLAAATALAAISGVTSLAREAAELGPRVGDVVVFDPAHPAPLDNTPRLIANRPGGASCVLDLAIVQQSGGSLVVEQRGTGANRFYRAHWAGPLTSEAPTDCGMDAELAFSDQDMTALAAAARGPDLNSAASLRLR